MTIRFPRLILRKGGADNGESFPFLLPLKTGKSALTIPAAVLLAAFLVSFVFVCPSYSGPCGKVVTYRIGEVDGRFGISRSEFSRLVKKAAEVWSVPFSADLIQETSNGRILIEMVYDHRQDASGKMQRIGADAKEDLKTYKGLKDRHDKLQKEHAREKGKWEQDAAEYRRRLQVYREEKVASLHRGRVSEETLKHLEREHAALNAMRDELQKRQGELKELAAKKDELIPQMQGVAERHHDNASSYRKESERLGGEYGKGVYHRWDKSITLYQYHNKDNLVQLIAHEFGHTLGIRHINDPNALMYPYDTGRKIEKLSPADIAALKAKCKK
ncbi:MAG: matrixin family metalloprotease [Syntrophobacterales bacterium]|nr:matrixin family metalloprotease [Syntrophobacterales bacterium]